MASHKGILVDPPFICWFFYEADCPICRYVFKNILLDLQHDNFITIESIDVQFNRGTSKVYWFEDYSEMFEDYSEVVVDLSFLVMVYCSSNALHHPCPCSLPTDQMNTEG